MLFQNGRMNSLKRIIKDFIYNKNEGGRKHE